MPVLPLFPLGYVLMPGVALPLRIFEPRYRQLVADVTADGAPNCFGVVALTSGLEVETPLDESALRLAQVGTVAEILEAHPAHDGTLSLLTGGTQRFRIERMVATSAPYLSAEVTFLAEVAGTMPETLPGAARALAHEYTRLIAALTGSDPDDADPYPTDLILLSYRLAADAPLAPEDRQQLLEDDTAASRLLRIQRVLRREVVLLRRTRSIAVSPAVLRAVLRPN